MMRAVVVTICCLSLKQEPYYAPAWSDDQPNFKQAAAASGSIMVMITVAI